MSIASLQELCSRALAGPFLDALQELSCESNKSSQPISTIFSQVVSQTTSSVESSDLQAFYRQIDKRSLNPEILTWIADEIGQKGWKNLSYSELIFILLRLETSIRKLTLYQHHMTQEWVTFVPDTLTQLRLHGEGVQNAQLLCLTSRCTKLRELSLERCEKVTDAGFGNLVSCRHLRHFSLKSMRVSASVFATLTSSECLKRGLVCLSLDDVACDLALIEELVKFHELKRLRLENMASVTDLLFCSFAEHTASKESMRELVLHNLVQLTDVGFLQVAAFSQLQTLAIENQMKLTQAGTKGMACLSTLVNVSLSCNRYLDKGALDALTSLQALEKLDLSHCKRLTLEALRPIEKLSSLRELSLGWIGNVDDACMTALKLPPSLEGLSLTSCEKISGNCFPALTQLRLLDLSMIGLKDSDVKVLTEQPGLQSRLQKLDLDDNEALTAEGAAYLTLLRSLDALSLNDCGIEAEEMAQLKTVLPLL